MSQAPFRELNGIYSSGPQQLYEAVFLLSLIHKEETEAGRTSETYSRSIELCLNPSSPQYNLGTQLWAILDY